MKVLSAGHSYLLEAIDNGPLQHVAFVKRNGKGYPWNRGHHGGIQVQEVLRMLIDRLNYVDKQKPHAANQKAIYHARMMIFLLEERAAERHRIDFEFFTKVGERIDIKGGKRIELLPACEVCGHLVCDHGASSTRSA